MKLEMYTFIILHFQKNNSSFNRFLLSIYCIQIHYVQRGKYKLKFY